MPPWLKRTLQAVLGLASLYVLFLLVGIVFLGHGTCSNEVVSSSPSPDGQRALVLFQRECGTAANAGVSVLAANAPLPNEPGNLLQLKLSKGLLDDVRAEWKDDRHVVFHHPNATEFFRHGGSDDDITVDFRPY